MQTFCLFCGSSSGNSPVYTQAAKELGQLLVQRKIRVVYGGGSVGMMGALADAVLAAKGEIIGIIPEFLSVKELKHPGVIDLRVVETMHLRKALMNELSDGFIAMPGGLGTLEEFFEVLTWAQLSIHHKPIGLLNTQGFFDPLVLFLQHLKTTGFISKRHLELLVIAETPEELLTKMAQHQFPQYEKSMLDMSIKHATQLFPG